MNFRPLISSYAGLALAVFTLNAMPFAHAQSALTEPDFSGMFAPTGIAQVVARDPVRGWNYVQSSAYAADAVYFINGIAVKRLSRVSDSGYVDLAWVGPDPGEVRTALVLANGDLVVYSGVYNNWQRLVLTSSGGYLPVPFFWTNEVLFRQPNSPIATDERGYRYAIFERPLAIGLHRAAVRRIAPDGSPDPNWRLDLDVDASLISRLAVAGDGSLSVFYVEALTAGAAALGRASVSDAIRWSTPLSAVPAALAADAAGRVYLLGNKLSVLGLTATLLRVDSTGAVDRQWLPAFESAGPGYPAGLQVVANRGVVVTSSPTARAVVRLVSLTDGTVLATRAIATIALISGVEPNGDIVVSAPTRLTLLSPGVADFSERFVDLRSGPKPIIADVKRWGSGYVVGGQFEYWYDGVRYSNLMRLGVHLKPDATWQPGVTGAVNALTIDRDGGLLVGGASLLDAQTSLIRFSADRRLDPQWRKPFDDAVFTVTAAADGAVFAGGRFARVDGINRSWIARFGADGSLENNWAQTLPWQVPTPFTLDYSTADGVKRIIDAGDGGVLVIWQVTPFFEEPYLQQGRFSRSANGPLIANSSALSTINPTTLAQDPSSGRLFGTRYSLGSLLVRLLPVTLELDPFWSPPRAFADLTALSDGHFYLSNGRRLLRSVNSATLDADWQLGAASIAGWLDTLNAGDALRWPAQGAPSVIRTPSQAIGQRTVIEYFAKNVQRFFITARAAEQQQLDAFPTQFARTGMQFSAFDAAVVPPPAGVTELGPPQTLFTPAGALPICRFYAPPSRGGSNTHFYGRGADCQFLNAFSGVINEGYDFAALPPLGVNGACPSNAPTPVYRLFNTLVASNNSNHRYVVSQARVDEMKARGWADEGIAFCATSATDSRAFGQW